MKLERNGLSLLLLILLSSILTISGCKSDDEGSDPTPVNPNPYQEINNWIYDNMDTYYLWTSQMPSSPDYTQEPDEFFEDLLSPQDRFSVIYPDYQQLINSLNGVTLEAGYEFILFRESSENENVIAIILYVKKDSPAEDAGLMRDDVITEINGSTMTLTNYSTILNGISSDHSISYLRFNPESSTYEDQGSVELSAVNLAENPNFIANVMDIDGQKIGYYMYNFFSPGVTNNEYDNEMDQIFADFKAEGISNLILDLRYNSGGSVASARNLASLIANSVTATDVFYENVWNDELQTYIESLSDGDDILRGKFAEKAENIGGSLSGQTVYILVGSRTASASELMINGLMPYMNVVIIGDQTIGKNVGSIPIEDEDNAENEYGMLPIVFQTYNSDGESNYANGFIPTGDNLVDEFQFRLAPLGTENDPLVARALESMGITVPGGRKGSRIEAENLPFSGAALKSSLDDKVRTNTIIMPEGTLPFIMQK